jgi:hypothetical protein
MHILYLIVRLIVSSGPTFLLHILGFLKAKKLKSIVLTRGLKPDRLSPRC